MKSRVTLALAIVVFAVAVCMGTSGIARADGLLGNWTLGDAGAMGNTIGNGATIADSSGNGFNGTVVGNGDTLQSVQGIIGNGMYFSGDEFDQLQLHQRARQRRRQQPRRHEQPDDQHVGRYPDRG